MIFLDKLRAAYKKNNSHVCVGLDSDYDKLPSCVKSSADPQALFNEKIIKATLNDVCAYKINIAFYECRGADGWTSLEKTVCLIPKNIPVIIDAKRADIGNTSAKYAEAIYKHLNADAITVNPYLGLDAIEPFLKYKDKCAFVLCHTSNPSSKEFQRVSVISEETDPNEQLYELVARKVAEWNKIGSCGLVVGANVPEDFQKVIAKAPGLPLLIPGIGAQKGDARNVIENVRGSDFIINSSRGIIFSSCEDNFDSIAYEKTIELKSNLNDLLK
ncbi:MAG: orotidine-5'-phosphate decarboxylase [candidate division Zixibacteria bacterium]|nr:orotidine-5'-phosphate decarboxylase [candidate division Zixibacteria bacterium]